MAYIFDITENMQASIRMGTGIHPNGPSFGIYIGTPIPDYGVIPKTAFEVTAYDACEWEVAVKLAKWILETDEAFKKVENNDTLVANEC